MFFREEIVRRKVRGIVSMGVKIKDYVMSEKSKQCILLLEDTLDRLMDFPQLKQYVGDLLSIEFFENDETDTVAGRYTPARSVIKLYINQLENDATFVYVFLHEFAHHVVHMRVGLDPKYDSVKQNRAFVKEELRAESLARVLAKKLFSDVKDMAEYLKVAKSNWKALRSLWKGDTIPSYKYTYEWKVTFSSDQCRQLALAA